MYIRTRELHWAPAVPDYEATDHPERTAPAASQPPSLVATIALHPDMGRVGERLRMLDVGSRGRTEVGRLEPCFRNIAGDATAPLGIKAVSRKPLVLTQHPGGEVELAVPPDGSQTVVAGREVRGHCVLAPEQLRSGVPVEIGNRVVLLLHWSSAPDGTPPNVGLIGGSAAIRGVIDSVLRVAGRDTAVLLLGESGVGKELVARAIHTQGRRKQAAFVAVNMSAIPQATAAAELFGHTRGAYTDAKEARPGFFREADGGTLFLDEIGEVSSQVQPLLLRALESGEVQTVGASQPSRTDVRVIAATDVNLQSAVERGDFRLPLLQRLAGYELRIPPLRERPEDIMPLLIHFLRAQLTSEEQHRLEPGDRAWLPSSVVAGLLDYHWPGNVREVSNTAQQIAVSNSGEDRFRVDESFQALLRMSAPQQAPAEVRPTPATARRDVDAMTDAEILEVLAAHDYSVQNAAKTLGVSRTKMHERAQRCEGLGRSSELTRAQIEASLQSEGSMEAAARALRVSPRALKLRLSALKRGDA